ncbi:hypothetical protein [Roseibium alexandrii]|uniref:hypothetical protein n=1 Tax=Roseibium alexandrii TaxID=388408 RepID=UPI0037514E7F
MKIRTLRMALTAAATLAISTPYAAEVDPALEQAVRTKAAETLVDPYSAVFTFDVVNEFEGGMAGKICGSVNAKNRYGAYTGQRFFYAGYVKTGGKYLVIASTTIVMRFDPAMAEGSMHHRHLKARSTVVLSSISCV